MDSGFRLVPDTKFIDSDDLNVIRLNLYKEGLNIDDKHVKVMEVGETKHTEGLNEDEKNNSTIYFTNLSHLPCFIGANKIIADAVIPKDAKIFAHESNTIWKSNKAILTNFRPLENHECWRNAQYCNYAVHYQPLALFLVVNQTPEMCEFAVEHCGYTLQHVKRELQTAKMCENACRQNILFLQDADPKYITTEFVINLILQRPSNILYIPKVYLTDELLAVVKQDQRTHDYIKYIEKN